MLCRFVLSELWQYFTEVIIRIGEVVMRVQRGKEVKKKLIEIVIMNIKQSNLEIGLPKYI